MAATRLLLLRHGQSEWNALGRWQGQADPPLSDLGWQQARLAAAALGTVDAIVSSDLQRATGTAMVLSEALGVGPVVIEPDLRERDAGEWSGLTRAEIDDRWPGYLGEGRRPPSWEPDDALVARVLAGLRRAAALVPGGEVLVVTHGGVIYSLEAHLGIERAGYLANVGGRWIAVDGERIDPGERVVLIEGNDDMVTVPRVI
jgi:probable phosphoglycerate mutase